MLNIISLRDFYQRKAILIGKNDRVSFLTKITYQDFEEYTHWLVALVGNDTDDASTEWKVMIYPSMENGEYSYKLPSFVSSSYQSFNEALAFAKSLEKFALEDQLFSFTTKN